MIFLGPWLLMPLSLSVHGSSWASNRIGASLAIRNDSGLPFAIPSVCYDPCNQMAMLIEEGSNCSSTVVLSDLRSCYGCLVVQTNETNFANYIQNMIDKCVLGETITLSDVPTSTTSQNSTSPTQISTTQASAKQTSTTQSSTARIADTTQLSNSSPGVHSNTSTIVPAVIVPVVVGLAAAFLFVFIKRRRRKRSITYPSSPPPLEYKAQLHADDFRPELDGSSASGERDKVVNEMMAEPVVSQSLVELPAEEVAREMGVNRENR